jgi:Icc-related predicted phosphoesterase
MKILAISDQRLPEMERRDYLRQNYSDVSFVISCGDMEVSYLEFITSVLNLPLFFVRGNHDDGYEPGYPGGQDLHMNYQSFSGITMVGLEGCVYYNGRNVQYTEAQMMSNALRIFPRLYVNTLQLGYGADYLVAHSPPKGIHDRPDRTHQGFKSFLWLMRLTKPRYLIHGHIDIWDRREPIETQYFETRVININPKRLLLPSEDDKI